MLPAGLRERVQSNVLTHEQTVPVAAEFAELFPEHALVRGRTLACAGPAATTTGMAVVAAAVAGGAWLAVVDIPTFGLDAASEVGIALERVVAVSVTVPVAVPAAVDPSGASGTSAPSSSWVEVMAAVVDGFDIVLARVPADYRDGQAGGPLRRLATRIRQRGAVVILLDDADTRHDGAMPCDGVIDSGGIVWAGLGAGFGALRQRTVELHLSGRRVPGRRQCRVTLPAVAHDGDTDVRVDADVGATIHAPIDAEVCA